MRPCKLRAALVLPSWAELWVLAPAGLTLLIIWGELVIWGEDYCGDGMMGSEVAVWPAVGCADTLRTIGCW